MSETIKNRLMNLCRLVVTPLAFLLVSAPAFADDVARATDAQKRGAMKRAILAPVHIPALRVAGLKRHAGKALLAYYVSSREATLELNGVRPFLREIKAGPVRALVSDDGEAVFPAAAIERVGSFYALNSIVWVVVDRDNFEINLKNVDGSIPKDTRPRVQEKVTEVGDASIYEWFTVNLLDLPNGPEGDEIIVKWHP